jgi:hypothetical protein
MTRKGLLVLVFAVLVSCSTFAQLPMSVGLGVEIHNNTDTLSNKGKEVYFNNIANFGVYAFFDAKYIEVNVEYSTYWTRPTINDALSNISYDLSYLALGLFGKYPIELGKWFTLSPMLGIQYDIALKGTYSNSDAQVWDKDIPSEYVDDYVNKFWIKVGASADINLGQHFFIRPAFLWGINFGTKNLRDLLDSGPLGAKGFYHGVDIKLALGYRF